MCKKLNYIMSETCEYCNAILINKTVLKTHLKTNKKCLDKRGLSLESKFIIEMSNSFLKRQIEDYESRIKRYDSKMEDFIKDAINKPTTTINNNMIREYLSTQYTIDSKKEFDLV